MARRPEEIARDDWLALVGAIEGLLVHRCEPMRNAWGVVALPDGFPDVFAAAEGKIVLIEWKSLTGKLKPSQVVYHAALAACGVQVLIARNSKQCCRDLAAIIGGEVGKRLLILAG